MKEGKLKYKISKMNAKSRIKIGTNFYEIELPLSLQEFKDKLHKNYMTELPVAYKLQYQDIDGDLITVCNQDDYDIALSDLKTPSVYLIANEAANKDTISIITVPKTLSYETTHNNKKELEVKEEPVITKEPNKNNEPGTSNKLEATHEARRDDKPEATDKGRVDNKPVASYEARTNEEVEVNNGPKDECFICKGKRTNKGKLCKLCKGTGEVDLVISNLKKDLEKTLREEMIRKLQEEVKRNELEQSNQCNSFMNSLSQLKILSTKVACSDCKEEIESGECFFYCLLCNDLYFCRNCGNEVEHYHTLLKGKKTGVKSKYQAVLIENVAFNKKVKANSPLSKTWKLKNTGKVNWPRDTKLVRVEGEDLNASVSSIGDIAPGDSVSVTILFFGPEKIGNYSAVFQLGANEELFGPKLRIEFNIEQELEQNDSLIKNTKLATSKLEIVKKDKRYKREYEDNLMEIFMLGDWEPITVLDLVIKHNNSIPDVIDELFGNR